MKSPPNRAISDKSETNCIDKSPEGCQRLAHDFGLGDGTCANVSKETCAIPFEQKIGGDYLKNGTELG
jgi:hypothetical protein